MANSQLDSPRRLTGVFIVGAVAALVIFLYGQIDYTIEPYAQSDLYHYRMMAAAAPRLAPAVQQPYAYRLLGPYLAGVLAGQEPWGFRILTMLAATAFGILYVLFLGSRGIGPPVAVMTTVLLLLNKHLFGYNVWNYFQINDLLSLVYLVILWWALPVPDQATATASSLSGKAPQENLLPLPARRTRWLVFGVTLVVGVLTRETVLLMIPVAVVFLVERRQLSREWRSFLLAVLPGLLCFVLLRVIVQPVGGQDMFSHFLRTVPKIAEPATWFRLLINAFIPVSLLPLIFWRHTLVFFRQNLAMLVFLLLVLVSAFFGTDNERLMAPAAVAFYLLLATIIERYLYPSRLAVVVLLAGGFVSSWQHFMGRYPLPSRELTLILSLTSLLVVSGVSAVVGYRRQR